MAQRAVRTSGRRHDFQVLSIQARVEAAGICKVTREPEEMASQNKNDLETKTQGKAQKENPVKEADQRTRKRPREYGTKEARSQKVGGNRVLHRRQVAQKRTSDTGVMCDFSKKVSEV